jgi:DNA-binding ferritin-like protein
VRAQTSPTDGGDGGTADLLTEISRQIDKDRWFFEAHLHGRRPAGRRNALVFV